MLAQVHFPQALNPEELDRYLTEGWFRMGQSIFTTNFLNFKQHYYSAIWLRLSLDQCSESKSQKQLMKLAANFRVEIQKANLRQEQEQLFARYRQEVSFEPSSSLHALLFGKSSGNIYDTYEVNIYDQEILIASGFFDLGKISAAGITSFYDPRYKKYSLGKLLIFLKIEYCVKAGLKYFYPGYFVPGYSAFDYKLKIHSNALQFLNLATNRWMEINSFSKPDVPVDVMMKNLNRLRDMLQGVGVESRIFFYDYFDANLVPDLNHLELFDSPVFLHFFDMHGDMINSLIVFDVRDQRFHWMIMKSVWMSDQVSTSEDHYTAHLLKVDEEVIALEDGSQLAQALYLALKTDLLKQKLG